MSSTLFTTTFAGAIDPSQATGLTPSSPTAERDVNQQDVINFNEAFAQNPDNIASAHSKPNHPLSHLASLEAEAMHKLQNLSTSLNPGDYMKTARTLAGYQLETMLTTKVIAKSTQAIEKLTNLQ